MSSKTSPPEPALARGTGAAWPRIALMVAYPLLAHAAAATGSGWLAALAAFDIALVLLIDALVRSRAAAWWSLAAIAVALAWLARTPHALLPLLLAPPAFVGLVGWAFARTLRAGRIPLVGRIAAALDDVPWERMEPDVQRYTRQVTWAWALLLGALAAADLALALLAPPLQWSWFANIGDYLVIGGFMLVEFGYRRLRFPRRGPGFAGFLRRMASLGPGFWREALR